MTDFEVIYLMIEFGMLIVSMLSFIVAVIALFMGNNTKK